MPVYQITHKTLYSFREMLEKEGQGVITSKAVEKAREWLGDAATDDEFWYEYTKEVWTEALEQIGFTKPDISFSGFWSQGDGASFTSGMDIKTLLEFILAPIAAETCIKGDYNGDPEKEDFRAWILHNIDDTGPYCEDRKLQHLLPIVGDYLSGEVYRLGGGGNYVHQHSCKVNLHFSDTGWHKRIESLVSTLEEKLEELRLDISHAIYKDLEEEYYYRRSDESIIGDSDANDYTFDRFGNREG